MSKTFQSLLDGDCLRLPADAQHERSVHRWSQPEIDALTLAAAAQRPLLVRGEPGTGKTQLARAAAHHQGRTLHSVTIHPRYEPQDLVYRFDAIRRLADAQAGAVQADTAYWEPGPLWLAFDWASAARFGSCIGLPAPTGHAILIDEIDKADSDLPNSLLELLGQRSLTIAPLKNLVIGGPAVAKPLIVITTTEERELPAAFLRRCVVLNLAPNASMSYQEWLLDRGQAHFGPDAVEPGAAALLSDTVMTLAAMQLCADRQNAKDAGLAPPGPAEYLDLLAALQRLAPSDSSAQLAWLKQLSAYAFVKHGQTEGQPGLPQSRPVVPGLGTRVE